MPAKKAFSYYRSYHDILKHLNDKQYVQLSRAINDVMFFECHIDSVSFKDNMVSALWASIKHTLQASIDGFTSKHKADYNSLLTTPYKGVYQGGSQGAYQQEKGEGEGKEKEKKRASKARPNSHIDVTEYAKSIQFDLDGEYFIDYNDQRGWKLKGGQDIKDWKACVRTWKKNGANNAINKQSPAKTGADNLKERYGHLIPTA